MGKLSISWPSASPTACQGSLFCHRIVNMLSQYSFEQRNLDPPASFNIFFTVLHVGTHTFVPSLTSQNLSTMKKLLLLLPVFALAMMAMQIQTEYKIDPTASKAVWTGYKVTGQHTGTVAIKNSKLISEGGRVTGGSFEIDMNSITCSDLQGEWAGKLVGHLKSDDFFGVEKYPTASFKITKAFPVDTKGNYRFIGNLTIKGTTKEIRFNAQVTEAGDQVTASAKINIDRTDYNVQYGSGSFVDGLGDKTIYDEFDVAFTLVGKK